MGEWSGLLQAAEQLANEVVSQEELPSVERSLSNLLDASTELYSRLTHTGPHDLHAHLLLGSKGIDLPQISQKLENLSSRKTFEPLHPIADSDVESFLRNERENAILSLIDEVNKSSLHQIEEQKWEHMVHEWNQEKIKLMNAMIGPSQNWLDLKRGPEVSTYADTTKRTGHSMLDNQEMAYAKVVHQHNKNVLQGAMKPLLTQKFAQVTENLNDPKVEEMWSIIKEMSSIPPLVKSEDPLKSRASPQVQRALITHAQNYLQRMYKTYMRKIVTDNLQSAQRGGIPGTYPLVKGFVGLRFQGQSMLGLTDGLVEGKPLWPMVYYCLRSGDLEAAVFCVKQAGPGFEEFIEVLEEMIKKPGLPLSNKLQTSINFQYHRNVRNATDPYKRAVYCILGGCDVSDEHLEVAKTADDYLWLKLCLIKDGSNSSTDSEAFTFADLQKMILEEYGESHYNAYEQPFVYFQVLALTGQFEAAIEFLSRIPRYQVHAVHVAIALSELYLLGGPRNVDAPLISVDIEDPTPMRRLNLARLILLYIKKFEITDPAEALQYFYFLRNMKDPNGKNLFMVCVADLALECRDYDTLFGSFDPVTDVRTRGLVDQFNSTQIDSKIIAANVAEGLVKKGLLEDAVHVFELAGNVEKVFQLCCTLLSQVVSEQPRAGSLRERLQHTCQRLAERHEDSSIPYQVQQTFSILTKLVVFFNQYYSKNYVGALETLASCEIVPLSSEEEHKRVAGFRHISGEVCKAIPDVLLAAVTILYNKYQCIVEQERTNSLKIGGKSKQVEFIREQVEALTSFAGNIPYRMPGDTYSQLTQMQIFIHN